MGTLELDPMTARRLGRPVVAVLAALAIAVLLAGCGGGGETHQPTATQLPLVDGANVVAQVRQCDKGANAYCAIELVVTDPRYRTSTDLVDEEHDSSAATAGPVAPGTRRTRRPPTRPATSSG